MTRETEDRLLRDLVVWLAQHPMALAAAATGGPPTDLVDAFIADAGGEAGGILHGRLLGFVKWVVAHALDVLAVGAGERTALSLVNEYRGTSAPRPRHWSY
jgi:hypothetical protein